MKDEAQNIESAKAAFRNYIDSDLWFTSNGPTPEAFEAYKALCLPERASERLLVWLEQHPEDRHKIELPEVSEKELREWFGPEHSQVQALSTIDRVLSAVVQELHDVWEPSRLRPEYSMGAETITPEARLSAIASWACEDIILLADAQGWPTEGEKACAELLQVVNNLGKDESSTLVLNRIEEILAKMASWKRKGDTTFPYRLHRASILLRSLKKVLKGNR